MVQKAYLDAINNAREELIVELANTDEKILECKQLRYKVYCEERDFLPGDNGIEEDEFDSHSHHALVRSRVTGSVYGTVRVVLSKSGSRDNCFPMQRVCDEGILKAFPLSLTGEISRFAVTRDRTGISAAAAALMRLCLLRGIVQISGECGLTYWCATMERTFLRLLRASGIFPQHLGEPVEYHGLRQPAVWALSGGFAQMKREHPHIWSFLTNDGAFWSDALVSGESSILKIA